MGKNIYFKPPSKHALFQASCKLKTKRNIGSKGVAGSIHLNCRYRQSLGVAFQRKGDKVGVGEDCLDFQTNEGVQIFTRILLDQNC
eukprot:879804-Pelagomonas_calceolata.AAC.2